MNRPVDSILKQSSNLEKVLSKPTLAHMFLKLSVLSRLLRVLAVNLACDYGMSECLAKASSFYQDLMSNSRNDSEWVAYLNLR